MKDITDNENIGKFRLRAPRLNPETDTFKVPNEGGQGRMMWEENYGAMAEAAGCDFYYDRREKRPRKTRKPRKPKEPKQLNKPRVWKRCGCGIEFTPNVKGSTKDRCRICATPRKNRKHATRRLDRIREKVEAVNMLLSLTK
jgi:hypothetical protein